MPPTARRLLVSGLLALGLFACLPGARAQGVPPTFPLPPFLPSKAELAAIDALVQAGEGEKALEAIRWGIRQNLDTPRSMGLTAAVERLAVAEALLGREDDARWHWDVAQALGSPSPEVAALGAAGAKVAAWAARGWDEVPSGVEPAGPAKGDFQPPRRITGDSPAVSAVSQGEPGPKWVQVKLVIDAEGRPSGPVAKGPSDRFTYQTLEGLRAWRFEPAKKGGVAVPAIFRLNVNGSLEKPLREMLGGLPELEKLEERLRAGADDNLAGDLDKVWRRDLDQGLLPHEQLSALLVLRALQLAAAGQESEAICLSQGAQGLRPDLFHADLDPYGASGRLLERNRYGVTRAAHPPQAGGAAGAEGAPAAPEIAKPNIVRSSQKAPKFTDQARKHGASGNILISAVLDETGAVRDPIVFGAGAGARGLDFTALAAVCQWRFDPARRGGIPVAVAYDLTINFAIAAGGPGPVRRPI